MVYDFAAVEKKINAYWKKIDLLKQLEKKNSKGKPYFLLDGPPYANFVPHVGHIRNTVYKDLNIRVAFMQGKNVLFQPGFDTHGLPVENKVEKKLGITSKKDIYKMGVEKFTKACKEEAATNKKLWMQVYEGLGSWYSWKTPYLSYDNSYVECGWWAFKELWKKKKVYQGRKPVYWCSSCETALAGYEVTDSYKQLTDPAIYIKCKVKGKDEHFLVFTTTPWTLVSNCALVVHPEEQYVKVETSQGTLILAEERLSLLTDHDIAFTVKKTFPGKELEGVAYEPLLDVPMQKVIGKNKKNRKVYLSIPILKERVGSKLAVKTGQAGGDVFEDFVTVEEGTGIVHCNPGGGKTDNVVGKHYGLSEESPLNDDGTFTEEAGSYKGIFVKEADKQIIKDLETAGKMLFHEQQAHRYPVCWRCKHPLLFRMSDQWFIEVPREKMLQANEHVQWQPDFAKERFAHWVANAEDWNVSRQRFWGIPIPIWQSEDKKETLVIGSKEELEALSGKSLKDVDLHTVSDITITSPKTGKPLTRVPDIFDVWYDASTAPFAALGSPFTNEDVFKAHYPVTRINESQDQVRGWFYYLMFTGVSVFDKAPFEEVSMPGWVLDEKGEKMSKSLGNVVWAEEGLKQFGADALRFYYCWDTAPYETQKFSVGTIQKEVHGIFNTSLNVLSYALSGKAEKKKLQEEDEWILSRLQAFLKTYQEALDSFTYHRIGRTFERFMIKEVSRGYIQMVRNRVEQEDSTVFFVLQEILAATGKALAPICPFFAEHVWQALGEKESVHLCALPQASKRNERLEEAMEAVLDIIQTGLSLREKAGITVRWPLPSITIATPLDLRGQVSVLEKQLNVKEVLFVEQEHNYEVSINYPVAGKKYGKDLPTIQKALEKVKGKDLHEAFSQKKTYALTVGKNTYDLAAEDVVLKEQAQKGMTAFSQGMLQLDTTLTPALEQEGYAREVMRQLQQMRKEAGLKKKDSINAAITSTYDLSPFEKIIKEKCGVETLSLGKSIKHLSTKKEVKIKDVVFVLSLKA